MELARLRACIATLAASLTEKERRRILWQKMYSNTHGMYLLSAVQKRIENTRMCVDYAVTERFCATPTQKIFYTFVSISRKKVNLSPIGD